ncbi:DUF6194 family protein [Kribbella sancticallisti]|uniref:DUF6194 family protein n=1 Tax=Kribbella sancticallisti TaxID=460087 RepID=A0ABP4P482_9ACTN
MDDLEIGRRLAATFPGVNVLVANGDSFFIYDPDRDLPPQRQMPFLTIVTSDSYDKDSQLDRPGVYRLNVGLTKTTYTSLFGDAAAEWDYAAIDTVMPHPVYAPQYWVCVLNPSEATLGEIGPLLTEAYDFAVRKYTNQRQRHDS